MTQEMPACLMPILACWWPCPQPILVPTTMISPFFTFFGNSGSTRVITHLPKLPSFIKPISRSRNGIISFIGHPDYHQRPILLPLNFKAINLLLKDICGGQRFYLSSAEAANSGGAAQIDLSAFFAHAPGDVGGTGGDTDLVLGERGVESRTHAAAGGANQTTGFQQRRNDAFPYPSGALFPQTRE